MLSKLLKMFGKKESTTARQTTAQKGDVKSRSQIKKKVSSTRIGEIGEYKIDIQLDQLGRDHMHLNDIMLVNRQAKSGFSQIDHIVISPYAIFVIETKNYTGTIYGERTRAKWSVNGKFPIMNPFNQNYGHIQAVKALVGGNTTVPIISIVSFNRRSTFKVNEELRKIQSNELIVYDTELSEFMMRKVNVMKLQSPQAVLTAEEVSALYIKLKENNIEDEQIRQTHINRLTSN